MKTDEELEQEEQAGENRLGLETIAFGIVAVLIFIGGMAMAFWPSIKEWFK